MLEPKSSLTRTYRFRPGRLFPSCSIWAEHATMRVDADESLPHTLLGAWLMKRGALSLVSQTHGGTRGLCRR